MAARRAGPCNRTLDGKTCRKVGDHLCVPRGDHVVKFFSEILLHTKGRWARQPFIPARWQERDILRPLFGTVTWNAATGRYVRRYRIAWLELARKNGKSELLAGIALYLLVGDDEEGAEIYGCARDRDQARKVFDVALRMVRLSAVLSRRITIREAAKRLVDERTASYYEVIAADAAGALGHNPAGIVFDEVITQPNADLWNALRTAMGAREQPLMVAATTAGDDMRAFAAAEHNEMLRIADDPARAPHVFVYMRNTARDADPWNERNWKHANPALGSFLSVQALRDEALEARNDPAKEHSFRQFRLNQWVSQASRWMPMHLWDASSADLWLAPECAAQRLAGRVCYAGFDLAAKFDLTAWALVFPPVAPDEVAHIAWRFWIPEAGLERLDRLHDGKFTRWAKAGWVTVTDGSVIDYDRVVADVADDAATFAIRGADCDEWSMWPVINRIAAVCGLDAEAGDVTAYRNTYDRMSPGMGEVMALVRQGNLAHHGNPVARFCFDSTEVRAAPYDPNLVRPVKPERGTDRARIDAVPAAAMAVNAWRNREYVEARTSAYETDNLMVL